MADFVTLFSIIYYFLPFHRFAEESMPCSIKSNAELEDLHLNGISGLDVLWEFDADFRELVSFMIHFFTFEQIAKQV